MGLTAIRILTGNQRQTRSRKLIVDHLSGLNNGESDNLLSDCFLDESFYTITDRLSWYADMVNDIVTKPFPIDLSRAQKGKMTVQSKYYV